MKTYIKLEVNETAGRIVIDLVRAYPKTARIVESFTFNKQSKQWARHIGPGNNPIISASAVARLIKKSSRGFSKLHVVKRYYLPAGVMIQTVSNPYLSR